MEEIKIEEAPKTEEQPKPEEAQKTEEQPKAEEPPASTEAPKEPVTLESQIKDDTALPTLNQEITS